MYDKIKKFIKHLIPKRVLYRNELAFRILYYQFYLGSKYQCNICNKHLRKFITIGNGDRLCPYCGSIARNRRLWELLKSEFLKDNSKILHFSPARSLYRILKKYPSIEYISSDYAGDFFADKHYDITHIDAKENTYDMVICYHILEHIEDDEKAMRELYRIIKKGGNCIIQTPFTKGETDEGSGIKTPEERVRHFGQSDHVRIYSVEGLKNKLTKVGFDVECRKFQERKKNTFGFKGKEVVLILKK